MSGRSTSAIAIPAAAMPGTNQVATAENLAIPAATTVLSSRELICNSGQRLPNQNATTHTCTTSNGANSQRCGLAAVWPVIMKDITTTQAAVTAATSAPAPVRVTVMAISNNPRTRI